MGKLIAFILLIALSISLYYNLKQPEFFPVYQNVTVITYNGTFIEFKSLAPYINLSCNATQQYVRDPQTIPFAFDGHSVTSKQNLQFTRFSKLSEACQFLDDNIFGYAIVSDVQFHEELTFGYSMFPTIIPGNIILFRNYNPNIALHVGYIVKANVTGLNSSLIHRVIGVNDSSGVVTLKGDNNIFPDFTSKQNISAIAVGVVYSNISDNFRTKTN